MKFKISSGLKSIIGRDLITNDFVAIFELVKNSFDAQATQVKIVFDLEDKTAAAIRISDNGKGMSDADIRNKWLFVAYSAKKSGEEDPAAKKVYAGSKGIGRFSCDRLGRMLVLESKTASQRFVNRLNIDWGEFEKKPKLEFGSISIAYEAAKSFTTPTALLSGNPSHGTVLTISDLREYESWTRDKLLRLRRSLQKLLDPFEGSVLHRTIELVCTREAAADRRINNGESQINGVVSNNVFGRFFVSSTVVQAVLKGCSIETTLTDRGVQIFSIAEDVEWSCPELTDCSVKCDIAYLNKASKAMFHRTMGLEAVKYGSVFLTHNGFRVFPVGEEIDDFWGLNRRKQQGYSRYVGTREVLGCVRVQDPHNAFQEASNREGLVNSPAVDALREFVIFAVRRLEAYLNRVTWRDPDDKENLEPESLGKDETRSRIIRLIKDIAASRRIKILDYNKDLIKILNAKSDAYGESLADLKTVAEKVKDEDLILKIDRAAAKFQKLQAELQKQRQVAQEEQNARAAAETAAAEARKMARQNRTAYDEEKKRNLLLISEQSRGPEFYECFIHNLAGDLKTARMSLEDMLTDYRKVYSQDPDFTESLVDLMELIENMQSLARFSISGNFRFDAECVEGDLVEFFRVYIDRIAKTSHRLINISFETDIETATSMFKPTGMSIVIDNLVSNSQKADARSISFKMSDGGLFWRLDVCDDGRGFDSSVDVNRIFEKAYSRTDGSGLGLYFCQKMLSDIKASIEVASSAVCKRGTLFIIKVPKK